MYRVPKPLSKLLCVVFLAGLPAASAWAQQAPPPPPRDRGDARGNDDNRRGSLSDAVRRVGRIPSAATVVRLRAAAATTMVVATMTVGRRRAGRLHAMMTTDRAS
jgi:hypothetical protein